MDESSVTLPVSSIPIENKLDKVNLKSTHRNFKKPKVKSTDTSNNNYITNNYITIPKSPKISPKKLSPREINTANNQSDSSNILKKRERALSVNYSPDSASFPEAHRHSIDYSSVPGLNNNMRFILDTNTPAEIFFKESDMKDFQNEKIQENIDILLSSNYKSPTTLKKSLGERGREIIKKSLDAMSPHKNIINKVNFFVERIQQGKMSLSRVTTDIQGIDRKVLFLPNELPRKDDFEARKNMVCTLFAAYWKKPEASHLEIPETSFEDIFSAYSEDFFSLPFKIITDTFKSAGLILHTDSETELHEFLKEENINSKDCIIYLQRKTIKEISFVNNAYREKFLAFVTVRWKFDGKKYFLKDILLQGDMYKVISACYVQSNHNFITMLKNDYKYSADTNTEKETIINKIKEEYNEINTVVNNILQINFSEKKEPIEDTIVGTNIITVKQLSSDINYLKRMIENLNAIPDQGIPGQIAMIQKLYFNGKNFISFTNNYNELRALIFPCNFENELDNAKLLFNHLNKFKKSNELFEESCSKLSEIIKKSFIPNIDLILRNVNLIECLDKIESILICINSHIDHETIKQLVGFIESLDYTESNLSERLSNLQNKIKALASQFNENEDIFNIQAFFNLIVQLEFSHLYLLTVEEFLNSLNNYIETLEKVLCKKTLDILKTVLINFNSFDINSNLIRDLIKYIENNPYENINYKEYFNQILIIISAPYVFNKLEIYSEVSSLVAVLKKFNISGFYPDSINKLYNALTLINNSLSVEEININPDLSDLTHVQPPMSESNKPYDENDITETKVIAPETKFDQTLVPDNSLAVEHCIKTAFVLDQNNAFQKNLNAPDASVLEAEKLEAENLETLKAILKEADESSTNSTGLRELIFKSNLTQYKNLNLKQWIAHCKTISQQRENLKNQVWIGYTLWGIKYSHSRFFGEGRRSSADLFYKTFSAIDPNHIDQAKLKIALKNIQAQQNSEKNIRQDKTSALAALRHASCM